MRPPRASTPRESRGAGRDRRARLPAESSSPGPRPWHRLSSADRLALAGLTALVTVFYWKAWAGESFYFRDVALYHHPLRKLITDSLRAGQLPLWNPTVGHGQPLLANPDLGVFYPTTLLALVLPFEIAFKLHYLLHSYVAAFGAYALLRQLRLQALPSFVGAGLYVFGGVVASLGVLYSGIVMAALAPLMLLFSLHIVHDRSAVGVPGLGTVLALAIFALEPGSGLAALAPSLAVLAVGARRSGRWRAVAFRAALAIAIGVALSMVQLLPFWDLYRGSDRGAGLDYSAASAMSLHPLAAVELLVPRLFGDATRLSQGYMGGALGPGLPYLVTIFVGVVPFLLAGAALLARREWWVRLFAAVALLAGLLAVGPATPLHPLLCRVLPFLGALRFPVKYLLGMHLSLVVLAAAGMESLVSREAPAPARLLTWTAAGLGVAFALLAAGAFAAPTGLAALFDRFVTGAPGRFERWSGGDVRTGAAAVAAKLVWPGIVAMTTAALLAWARGRSWRPAVLASLALGPVLFGNFGANPTARDFYETSEVARILGGDPSLFRVIAPDDLGVVPPDLRPGAPSNSRAWGFRLQRRVFSPEVPSEHGISAAMGLDLGRVFSLPYHHLYRLFQGLDDEQRIGLLRLVNCKYLLSFVELRGEGLERIADVETGSNHRLGVYRDSLALERAYFVARARVLPDDEAVAAALVQPGFDPRREVLLSAPAAPPVASVDDAAAATPPPVVVTGYSLNDVSLQVAAPTGGYVVLSDTFHPWWRAEVDGQAVPIQRANLAFRAVAVTRGAHRLHFYYDRRWFLVGAAVSLAALAGCLAALAIISRRGSARRTG